MTFDNLSAHDVCKPLSPQKRQFTLTMIDRHDLLEAAVSLNDAISSPSALLACLVNNTPVTAAGNAWF